MAGHSEKDLDVLHHSHVPPLFKEPYILSGYRKPNCTYKDCIKYTLVLHNETGNFWTHFIPMWLWLIWLYSLSTKMDLTEPYFYPAICFWVSACIYALCSSIAHGFACKSPVVRDITMMLDYVGISMYTFGGVLLSFYYQLPTSTYPTILDYKWPLLILGVILAVDVVVLSSLSMYFWSRQRYFIRALSAALPCIFSAIPFLYRFRLCVMTEKECLPETMYLHLCSIAAIIAAATFFVSKIPECFYPGKFDYIGQSHQLFHVALTVHTSAEMFALPLDTLARKNELTNIANYTPDIFTTFFLHTIVLILDLFTLAVLGYLVSKGVLVNNRRKALCHEKEN